MEMARGKVGIYTRARQADVHHDGRKATYWEPHTFDHTIDTNRAIRVQVNSSFSVRITH
jgi:hypothetical protein